MPIDSSTSELYLPPYTPEKIAALLKDPKSWLSTEQRNELELVLFLNECDRLIEREITLLNEEKSAEISAGFNEQMAAYNHAQQEVKDQVKGLDELGTMLFVNPAQFIAIMWTIQHTAFLNGVSERLIRPVTLPDGSTYTISDTAKDEIFARLSTRPTPAQVVSTLEALDMNHPALEARRLREKELLGAIDENPTIEARIAIAQRVANDFKDAERAEVHNALIIANALREDFRRKFGPEAIQAMKQHNPLFQVIGFFNNVAEHILNSADHVNVTRDFNNASIRAKIEGEQHGHDHHLHSAAAVTNALKGILAIGRRNTSFHDSVGHFLDLLNQGPRATPNI